MRNSDDFVITDAFYFIDFSKETLIKESFLIMFFSKGGLSLDKIKELPFNEYELCVTEAERIQKLYEKEETN